MKILVVEDDRDLSQVISNNLKTAGFTAETAAEGERGSYLARINHYDLIILDYNLPKLDGLGVCREIRADGQAVPILMLTVRSELRDKLDLFAAGVDDYLTKPFSFSELLARIKAILKRPPIRSVSLINFKDLEIDLDNFQVKTKRGPIYLNNKEFALLQYLVQNHDRIASREMIRENVWGDKGDPFSNTVETHILKLRHKLAGSQVAIKTWPGRGYKLE